MAFEKSRIWRRWLGASEGLGAGGRQTALIEASGCLPAIDRLKRLLYEITAEVQGSSQQAKIQVPLKHHEMAQMIAVTPEYLCRLLKKLEEEKIITRDKGSLMVNDTKSLKQGCRL